MFERMTVATPPPPPSFNTRTPAGAASSLPADQQAPLADSPTYPTRRQSDADEGFSFDMPSSVASDSFGSPGMLPFAALRAPPPVALPLPLPLFQDTAGSDHAFDDDAYGGESPELGAPLARLPAQVAASPAVAMPAGGSADAAGAAAADGGVVDEEDDCMSIASTQYLTPNSRQGAGWTPMSMGTGRCQRSLQHNVT